VACAGEPPPRAEPPPPAPPALSTTANTAAPLSPIELSQRALAEASTTKDPHERCRLLMDATILDPTSIDAQLARAESRCAFASELLPNARAAFAARKDQRSAEALAAVAGRAGSRADQKLAAAVLATLDVSAKLTAARVYAVDEPERAAAVFDEVAAAREAKGATLDALDARLDAAMARADAGKPSGLAPLIDAAANAAKSYGAAWVAQKTLEALAAARVAGESTTAMIARGEKLGLFAGAADALAIERAIAGGKELPHLHARVRDPALRALHVLTAKDCATASAHARAHRRLPQEGLVLSRDVARALKKICPNGEVAGRGTIFEPRLSPELLDLVEVARVEPLRARARLEQLPKSAESMSARLQIDPSASLSQAIAASPGDAYFSLLQVAAAPKEQRAKLAVEVVTKILPSTIEATVSRGLSDVLMKVLALADSESAEWDDVAVAAVSSCAASTTGACVPDLSPATSRLRRRRTAVLAAKGPLLAPEDLTPLVRLDVIVALVEQKKLAPAIKLRSGSSPAMALADAMITATNGNCPVAKAAVAKAVTLMASHSDVFARIAKTCP